MIRQPCSGKGFSGGTAGGDYSDYQAQAAGATALGGLANTGASLRAPYKLQ